MQTLEVRIGRLLHIYSLKLRAENSYNMTLACLWSSAFFLSTVREPTNEGIIFNICGGMRFSPPMRVFEGGAEKYRSFRWVMLEPKYIYLSEHVLGPGLRSVGIIRLLKTPPTPPQPTSPFRWVCTVLLLHPLHILNSRTSCVR